MLRSAARVSLDDAKADLAAANALEIERKHACVDLYYRSALRAWQVLESAGVPSVQDAGYRVAWQVYQQSLTALIEAGQRHARLDPRRHLLVWENGRRLVVPVVHHGFAWKPADFCQLIPADEFQGADISRYYRTPGLGVRLVAVRAAAQAAPFFRDRHPFAATAVLRPVRTVRSGRECPGPLPVSDSSEAVLEFYNPHLFERVALGHAVVPLERDLTAPWAFTVKELPRRYLEGFLAPFDTQVKPKLLMVEPYQRGKIPVVFIHGLLSDPMTWVDAANELRAQPDVYQRFQFWGFRYPTGGALLESAADLREKLLVARELCDPGHEDPAMDRMILVGHSMGGLVARLQVTYSLDTLWRHAAKQPLEAVRTMPVVRERLRRDFFFDPSPLVTRVVFIGTPHRGSAWSRRVIGRVGSSLVRQSADEDSQYLRPTSDNRDIFYPYLWRSRPTSVDLLEPSSPLLGAMALMPFSQRVRLHSIIGTGGTSLFGEAGDGVVPVSSARLGGVCSELRMPVRHDELHHDSVAMAELMRILREHACEPD
jgi:pimeloyl-ACP methyl ester carboxylesterase